MSVIEFSDGMKFNTSGPLRGVKRGDGWYVVGEGMLIPCSDEDEVEEILKDDEKNKETIMNEGFPSKTTTLAPSNKEGFENVKRAARDYGYQVYSDGKYVKIKCHSEDFAPQFKDLVRRELRTTSFMFYDTIPHYHSFRGGMGKMKALRIRHWDFERYS